MEERNEEKQIKKENRERIKKRIHQDTNMKAERNRKEQHQ
jgi:hypothetical protein